MSNPNPYANGLLATLRRRLAAEEEERRRVEAARRVPLVHPQLPTPPEPARDDPNAILDALYRAMGADAKPEAAGGASSKPRPGSSAARPAEAPATALGRRTGEAARDNERLTGARSPRISAPSRRLGNEVRRDAAAEYRTPTPEHGSALITRPGVAIFPDLELGGVAPLQAGETGEFRGTNEEFRHGTNAYETALDRRSEFRRQSPAMRALQRGGGAEVEGSFMGHLNQLRAALDPTRTTADYDLESAALPTPTTGERVAQAGGSLVGMMLPFSAGARGLRAAGAALAPADLAAAYRATGVGGRMVTGAAENVGFGLSHRGATEDPDLLRHLGDDALIGAGFGLLPHGEPLRPTEAQALHAARVAPAFLRRYADELVQVVREGGDADAYLRINVPKTGELPGSPSPRGQLAGLLRSAPERAPAAPAAPDSRAIRFNERMDEALGAGPAAEGSPRYRIVSEHGGTYGVEDTSTGARVQTGHATPRDAVRPILSGMRTGERVRFADTRRRADASGGTVNVQGRPVGDGLNPNARPDLTAPQPEPQSVVGRMRADAERIVSRGTPVVDRPATPETLRAAVDRIPPPPEQRVPRVEPMSTDVGVGDYRRRTMDEAGPERQLGSAAMAARASNPEGWPPRPRDSSFVRGQGIAASDDRLAEIRAVRDMRQYGDIRGHDISDPQDLHALLAQFNDPLKENQHVILTDDANTVLSHSMLSSDALAGVSTKGRRYLETVIGRARRAGATRLFLAHNHPYGDPTPSLVDKESLPGIARYMRQRGGPELAGSYIMGADSGEFIQPEELQGDRMGATRALYAAPPGAHAQWPQPQGGSAINSRDALFDAASQIYHPDRIGVLYLDTDGRPVAHSSHKIESLATLPQWLRQHQRAHGADMVVLSVPERYARDAAGAARLARSGGASVLDVVGMGKVGPLDLELGAVERGMLEPFSAERHTPPIRSARTLFSNPGADPEVWKRAIASPAGRAAVGAAAGGVVGGAVTDSDEGAAGGAALGAGALLAPEILRSMRAALRDGTGAAGPREPGRPLRRRDLPASMRVMPANLSPSTRQAWLQGERAGKFRLTRDVNQHPEGSPEWKAFEQGWRSQQPRQRGAEVGLKEAPREPPVGFRAAAIRLPDGRYVEGANHAEAADNALISGMVHPSEYARMEMEQEPYVHGFVRADGRFYSREDVASTLGNGETDPRAAGSPRATSEGVFRDRTGAVGGDIPPLRTSVGAAIQQAPVERAPMHQWRRYLDDQFDAWLTDNNGSDIGQAHPDERLWAELDTRMVRRFGHEDQVSKRDLLDLLGESRTGGVEVGAGADPPRLSPGEDTARGGASNIAPLTSIVVGGAGAAYGYTQGDTPEERAANALAYGAGGAVAGGLLPGIAVSMAKHAGNRAGVFGDPHAFYSRLDRSINEFPQERGTPEQWAAFLGSRTARGEREWVGIDQFLRDAAERKEPITREQVRALYDRGAIRLQEVQHGGREPVYRPIQNGDGSGTFMVRNDATGHVAEERISGFDARDRASAIARRLNKEQSLRPNPPVKFSQYTVAGGENYREVLVTLPDRAPEKAGVEWTAADETDFARMNAEANRGPTWGWTDEDAARFADLSARRAAIVRAREQGASYRSPHWDEPNVLLHLRMNDRALPNGEKALFVEELQSDWHQQGRRSGYSTRANDEVLVQQWAEANGHPVFSSTPEGLRSEGAPAEVVAAKQRLIANAPDGVPDAPFRRTEEWLGLGMKRVLDEAAAGGYDRVSWATGAQQAERYDLSKQVRHIDWRRNPRLRETDPPLFEIAAVGLDGEEVLHESGATPASLAQIIGKEPAERIANAGAAPGGLSSGRLSGVDLQVGGEGMRAFYDRMIPNWLKDYARKLGVKIDVAPVEPRASANPQRFAANDLRISQLIRVPEDQATPEQAAELARSREENASLWPGEPTGIEGNPSFRVTPELRERIRQGQPIGAVDSRLMRGVAGASTGAAIGAATDDEDRAGGAAMWAVAGLGAGLAPEVLASVRRLSGNRLGMAGDLSRIPVEVREGGGVFPTGSYPPEAYLTVRPDGTADLHLNSAVTQNENGLRRFSDAFDGPGGDYLWRTEPGSALVTHEPAHVQWDGTTGVVVRRGTAGTSPALAQVREPVAPPEPKQRVRLTAATGEPVPVVAPLEAAPAEPSPSAKPRMRAVAATVPTMEQAHQEMNAALGGTKPHPQDLFGLAQGTLSPEDFAGRYGIDATTARSYATAAQAAGEDADHVSPLDAPENAHARPPTVAPEFDHVTPPEPRPVDAPLDEGERLRRKIPESRYGAGAGQAGMRLFPGGLRSVAGRTAAGTVAGTGVGAALGALDSPDDRAGGAARGAATGAQWGAALGAGSAVNLEAAAALRRAELLANVSGIGRDILQNALPTETLADYAAYPLERAMALYSGTRAATVHLPTTLQAAWKGATTGMADFVRKARGRPISEASGRGGAEAASRGVEGSDQRRMYANPVMDFAARSTGRIRGAVDMPAAVASRTQAIDQIARVEALNEHVVGPARAARVTELKNAANALVHGGEEAATLPDALRKTAETMNDHADAAVMVSTFTNPSTASWFIRKVREATYGGEVGGVKIPDMPRARGALDFFAAFKVVPGALADMTVQMSPLGTVKFGRDFMKWVRAVDGGTATPAQIQALQRATGKDFGRVAVGTGIAWYGAHLMRNGRMTGLNPTPQQRADGALPFSVLVHVGSFRHWIPVGELPPVGLLLAMGAEMEAARQGGEHSVGQFDQGQSTLLKKAGETALLRATGDVQDLFNRGKDRERVVNSLASSFVPTVVGQVAGGMDGVQRKPETPWQAIEARIPALSRRVPAKINPATGQDERTGPGGVVGALERVVDFTRSRPSQAASTPLGRTLRDLNVNVPPVTRQRGESPETYRQRQRVVGHYVGEVLNTVTGDAEPQEGFPFAQQREDYHAATPEAARQALDADPELRDAWHNDAGALARAGRADIVSGVQERVKSEYSTARREALAALRTARRATANPNTLRRQFKDQLTSGVLLNADFGTVQY